MIQLVSCMIPIEAKMATKNALKEKMSKNTDNILGCLESEDSNFYKISELRKTHNLCINNKYIYQNTTFKTFEAFLKEQGVFKKKVTLDFSAKKYTRYFLSEPNIYELALSINSEVFLSHYTAVHLHNLTNNIPKTIFVNLEKSKPLKSTPKKVLEQKEIDKAMYLPPRISSNLVVYGIYTVNLLSSKYSNALGIISKEINGQKLRLTNIERTLIDITVSPHYCGGTYEVLNVYKKAKGKFSPEKLRDMLQKLDYIYPFHQCIGFFMDKAGYPEKDLKLFEGMGIQYKFFVQRELRADERKFDERWRLFYPEFF